MTINTFDLVAFLVCSFSLGVLAAYAVIISTNRDIISTNRDQKKTHRLELELERPSAYRAIIRSHSTITSPPELEDPQEGDACLMMTCLEQPDGWRDMVLMVITLWKYVDDTWIDDVTKAAEFSPLEDDYSDRGYRGVLDSLSRSVMQTSNARLATPPYIRDDFCRLLEKTLRLDGDGISIEFDPDFDEDARERIVDSLKKKNTP